MAGLGVRARGSRAGMGAPGFDTARAAAVLRGAVEGQPPMLKQGNTAPVAPLAEALGWTPRELGTALASEPSTEAALWHARLFFLRPALRIGLAIIWIWTAIVSAFVYPLDKSIAMVADLGVSGWQAAALVCGGAAVDGILGLALLFNIRPA